LFDFTFGAQPAASPAWLAEARDDDPAAHA
jgi:hypothetical protein